MIATLPLAQAQAQTASNYTWLVFMVIVAVAAAGLLLFAAWANRRWRKK
jgi:hypothetical protein